MAKYSQQYLMEACEDVNSGTNRLNSAVFDCLQTEEGVEILEITATLLYQKHGSQGPVQVLRTAIPAASIIVADEQGQKKTETKNGKTRVVKNPEKRLTIARDKDPNTGKMKDTMSVKPSTTTRKAKVEEKADNVEGLAELVRGLCDKFGWDAVGEVWLALDPADQKKAA